MTKLKPQTCSSHWKGKNSLNGFINKPIHFRVWRLRRRFNVMKEGAGWSRELNGVDFAGLMASVATTQLCHYSAKAATANM